MALEHTANRYRCTAYDDYAGAVWVEGDFVLARSHWDEARKKASFAPVSSSPSAFEYTAFDGETIYLAGAMVLVPDGWIINYPGEAGGVKQFFEMGCIEAGKRKNEELHYRGGACRGVRTAELDDLRSAQMSIAEVCQTTSKCGRRCGV